MEKIGIYKLENGKRVDTGRIYIRNEPWPDNEDDCYIVGINNWIINKAGKLLVQRRAMTKKNNPGKWSSTNGLIQYGETNIETVKRETKEELGIEIEPNQIFLFKENHFVDKHWLVDIFITYANINLENIKIQESEVDKVAFVTLDEFLAFDISTTCSYIKELAPMMKEKIKEIKTKINL